VRASRAILGLAVAALLAACGAGVATTAGAGTASPARPPLRVLLLTQTRGYRHASIPTALAALQRMARSDGRYALVPLASAAQLGTSTLHRAAAVVFLLTSGELPLSAAGKQALSAFVHGGGALIGFHSATDTFHHWPGYIGMIGGEFSHHPLPSTQRLIVEDRGSAATRTLPASFRIHEEFYVFTHDPRRTSHVLVRLDTGPGGPDRPLAWCRRVGHGRVFYDALGHFPQTWRDGRLLALADGGIDWALGLGPAGGC
jgi:type 1 glutamine amidotransferase